MSTETHSPDVVIVGAGVVGAAVAFYLRRRGIRSILVEQDGIASHASGFALGGLHPRVPEGALPAMQQFTQRSFDHHAHLHKWLTEESEEVSTWRTRSSIQLALSGSEYRVLRSQAEQEKSRQTWLSTDEILKDEPHLSTDIQGGLRSQESAELNSASLVKSLVNLSQAEIVLDKVTSIQWKGSRITGLVLASDKVIQADRFVFAMGPWMNQVLEWLKFSGTLVHPLKGQILRLQVDIPALKHTYSVGSNYLNYKTDGLIWVGTTEENEGFNESTTREAAEAILSVFQRVFSESIDFKTVLQTACIRPMSLDNSLILGSLPGHDNVILATGGGRKGILYGPLMGYQVAKLISSGEMDSYCAELNPGRLILSRQSQ